MKLVKHCTPEDISSTFNAPFSLEFYANMTQKIKFLYEQSVTHIISTQVAKDRK